MRLTKDNIGQVTEDEFAAIYRAAVPTTMSNVSLVAWLGRDLLDEILAWAVAVEVADPTTLTNKDQS